MKIKKLPTPSEIARDILECDEQVGQPWRIEVFHLAMNEAKRNGNSVVNIVRRYMIDYHIFDPLR